MSKSVRFLFACAIVCVAVAPAAHAQWPVVDAPATTQLVQEVLTTGQQLVTMKSQLQQAAQTLQSMSGARGMEQLLSGVPRNYLPASWSQLSSLSQGAGNGYGALGASVQNLQAGNAVLSAQRLATLSPAEQQMIAVARHWVATNQAVSQSALANSSARFAEMQTLINAIAFAGDQKGILDLQARINAEQGMLQNEQTKLQVLSHTMQAQEAAVRQQQREQIITAHGQFENRFQPVP
jgi:type IV secretion system protein VirB5